MSIQSVSNVSFGATSKNGNEYKKSHVGTIAGTAVGFGVGAFNVATTLKSLKTIAGKREYLTDVTKLANKFATIIGKKIPYVKGQAKSMKSINVAVIAVNTLIGLGVGALINKAINKSKANKADKAAAKAQ